MLTARRTVAALGAILLGASCLVAAAPAVPTVEKAVPATEWDAKFAGKKGWIGGDAVYSVALGPKRILWLFGDTLVGTVKEKRRTGASMVNNTIAVQSGLGKDAEIRFVTGKAKEDKPAAFFTPSDGKGWLWPQDGLRIGDRVYLFLPQIDKTGKEGPFGFKHIGQWLGVVENPDDEPQKWRVKQHKIPFASFEAKRIRSWGAAMLHSGEHVYVYGYDDEQGKGFGKRRLTLARVPAEKLADFRAWRFCTAGGWGEKAGDAVALTDGIATEFSVSRAPNGKGYVMVYTENGLGDRIVGRFADAPEGPWSAPVLLYKCPEMAKDKGVFCYSAKAHPWAAGANELVISYCVNSWKFGRLFEDESVYRPKFVRVTLGRAK